MPRYHVENFGCRASQADGDGIAALLEGRGAVAAGSEPPNVVVVNTCSVTAEAERDGRAYIRKALRNSPAARIIVTGCYAQRAPREVSSLPGVHAVVGNTHKNHIAEVALDCGKTSPPTGSVPSHTGFFPLSHLQAAREPDTPLLLASDIFAHTEFQLPPLPGTSHALSADRTRPTLKIQDGCGNRCTFCIIPSTRGNSRSLPWADVLDAVRRFADPGGTELVLSGINLGRWGRDLVPPRRFDQLVSEILANTALPRLRISSVEPMDWTDNLIGLLARWGGGEHARLARHAHLPLQSGSDSVLRRMHRRYRPWHYAERVTAIHSECPQASIGADVMVGFPGETEREFQENFDFIAALPFTYLHLFPFSARPGTPAWQLHDQQPVPATMVRERMAALRDLIAQKNQDFRSKFIGNTLSAVTLKPDSAAIAHHRGSALADNFLPIALDAPLPPNQLIAVKITGLTRNGLAGQPDLPHLQRQ